MATAKKTAPTKLQTNAPTVDQSVDVILDKTIDWLKANKSSIRQFVLTVSGGKPAAFNSSPQGPDEDGNSGFSICVDRNYAKAGDEVPGIQVTDTIVGLTTRLQQKLLKGSNPFGF